METASRGPDPFFNGYSFDCVLNRPPPDKKVQEKDKQQAQLGEVQEKDKQQAQLGAHFNISQIKELLPGPVSKIFGRIFKTKSYKDYTDIKSELKRLASALQDRLELLEHRKDYSATHKYTFTPDNVEQLGKDWRVINEQLTAIAKQLQGTVLEKNEYVVQLNETQKLMAKLISDVKREIPPPAKPYIETVMTANHQETALQFTPEPELPSEQELDSLIQSIIYPDIDKMKALEKLEFAVHLLATSDPQIEEFLQTPPRIIYLRQAFNKVFVETESPVEKLRLMKRMDELLDKGMSGKHKDVAERHLNFHNSRMCIDFIRSRELPHALVKAEKGTELYQTYLDFGGNDTTLTRAKRGQLLVNPEIFREQIEKIVANDKRDLDQEVEVDAIIKYYQDLCAAILLDPKFTQDDLIRFLRLTQNPDLLVKGAARAAEIRRSRGEPDYNLEMAKKIDTVLKSNVYNDRSKFHLALFFDILFFRKANMNLGL